MFGKKLLNVVGLLTLVKFSSAGFANSLTSCSDPDKTDAATINYSVKYCIDGSNKIHDYGAGGDTDAGILGEGVYVFDHSSKLALELGTSGSIGGSTNNLILYQCGSDKVCKQTTGFVQIGNNVWFYVKENGSGSETPNATGLSGNDDCDSGTDVGGLINYNFEGVRLCLTTTKSVAANTDGDYLVVGTVTDTNPPFVQYNSIITTGDYFIVDKLFSAEELCYSSTDGSLMISRENFCTPGADCSAYYKCTEGTCEPATETCPRAADTCVAAASESNTCEGGYAIISELLYKCTTSGSACTVETPKIGYYKAVNDGSYAGGYITCAGGADITCSKATKVTADDCQDHLGKIITSGNICVNALAADSGIDLAASKQYLIDASANISDLGITGKTSSFVVLSVDSANNKATILTYGETTERYLYINKNDNKKTVAARGTVPTAGAICPVSSNTMAEYKKQINDSCVNNAVDTTTVAYYKNTFTASA